MAIARIQDHIYSLNTLAHTHTHIYQQGGILHVVYSSESFVSLNTHSRTLLRNLMSLIQRSQHPVRGKVTSPGNRMHRAPAAILIRAKQFPALCFSPSIHRRAVNTNR